MKYIFTGFAPNLTKKDLKTALSFLLSPFRWKYWQKGEYVKKFEDKLKNFFSVQDAVTFDSGRSALYFALKSIGVGEGDEVLVQSFTCVVVINAIKWTGATPVYVDIKDDFNIDLEDLKKKKTSKTKVLIIQHTFGKPADINNLMFFARENNLLTIEDCAHSLGAKYENNFLGTFADIGMFSFGSDKVLSCVRGGALVTNNQDFIQKIREYSNSLPETRYLEIFQHLIHYPLFYFGKLTYHLLIGKYILAFAKKINLINKIIYKEEKMGLPVIFYPAKFPNALAKIIHDKFESLQDVVLHQQKIANYYNQNIISTKIVKPVFSVDSIWLRYTILTEKSNELLSIVKREGIMLGDWYSTPIAPVDVDFSSLCYIPGSCTNDERLSKLVVNLPTDINIDLDKARKIVDLVNKF